MNPEDKIIDADNLLKDLVDGKVKINPCGEITLPKGAVYENTNWEVQRVVHRFPKLETPIFQSIQTKEFFRVLEYNPQDNTVCCNALDKDNVFQMDLDMFMSMFTCISSRMLEAFNKIVNGSDDDAFTIAVSRGRVV